MVYQSFTLSIVNSTGQLEVTDCIPAQTNAPTLEFLFKQIYHHCHLSLIIVGEL